MFIMFKNIIYILINVHNVQKFIYNLKILSKISGAFEIIHPPPPPLSLSSSSISSSEPKVSKVNALPFFIFSYKMKDIKFSIFKKK